ncbi:hypothetical protein BDZ94DRAFT_473677 [Collybia nuda]|uniref:Uncharacterized protein n=1 Tax=Collybia nuda TaxID=64659 RepID=A0A9P5Y720_9AGAR|nr:hypothetical protein BDZ94DRAFT_473677 [Collybia nuda]
MGPCGLRLPLWLVWAFLLFPILVPALSLDITSSLNADETSESLTPSVVTEVPCTNMLLFCNTIARPPSMGGSDPPPPLLAPLTLVPPTSSPSSTSTQNSLTSQASLVTTTFAPSILVVPSSEDPLPSSTPSFQTSSSVIFVPNSKGGGFVTSTEISRENQSPSTGDITFPVGSQSALPSTVVTVSRGGSGDGPERPSQSGSSNGKSSIVAILGGVLGGIAFLLLCSGSFVLYFRCKRRHNALIRNGEGIPELLSKKISMLTEFPNQPRTVQLFPFLYCYTVALHMMPPLIH